MGGLAVAWWQGRGATRRRRWPFRLFVRCLFVATEDTPNIRHVKSDLPPLGRPCCHLDRAHATFHHPTDWGNRCHNPTSKFAIRWALTEDRPLIKAYDEVSWAELPDAASAPIGRLAQSAGCGASTLVGPARTARSVTAPSGVSASGLGLRHSGADAGDVRLARSSPSRPCRVGGRNGVTSW